MIQHSAHAFHLMNLNFSQLNNQAYRYRRPRGGGPVPNSQL
ncbi:hypothetical protein [Cryptosporidium hominis TU502]|nr:hypothetical protein [Cryptosporidium hominis TU502]